MKPGISRMGSRKKKGRVPFPELPKIWAAFRGKSRPGTEAWRGWQGFGVAPFLGRLPGALRTGAKLHRRLVVTDDPPIEP